jgi:hypothetical protein
MSKIFKPRRVKYSSIAEGGSKANVVLANGETVFVMPDTGAGTGLGSIIMGDGTTAISNLPYMINGKISENKIEVVTNSKTTANAALTDVISGNTLGTVIGALKQASSLNASAATNLNNERNALQTKLNSGLQQIYNACVEAGTTPSSASVNDINVALEEIFRGGYTAEQLNTNSSGTNKLLATINSLSDAQAFVEKYIKSDGKFDKSIRVGDKIQINDGTYNKEWIIVGFNTQSSATSQPHISLIPTDSLGNFVMNNRDDGGDYGYANSNASRTCNTMANNLASVLGNYLLTRTELLGTSGWREYETFPVAVRVNLLNEMQVFGRRPYSVDREDGYDTVQLPGFRLNKVYKTISSSTEWWLRSARANYPKEYCIVANGSPSISSHGDSHALRPLITIGRR